MAITESFNENVTLGSSLLNDSGVEELHNEVEVEVDSSVLHLIVLVNHADLMESSRKLTLSAVLKEALTKGGVGADMLSDQLMNRKVEHVIFDSEVSARHVNG